MQAKPFFQSKTLIGAAVMGASLLLQRFHVAASADEINTAVGQAVDAFQLLSGVVGFVMVIVGRVKARSPIQNPLG